MQTHRFLRAFPPRLRFLLLALSLAFRTPAAPGAELHVSPAGDDANPGTHAEPYATLSAARDAIRAMPAPRPAITVSLHAGTYRLTESFRLEARDSGRPDAPITYRAVPGEKVMISGGSPLDPRRFTPLADDARRRVIREEARSRIRQLDLRACGVREFPRAAARGMAHPIRPAPMELFCDGEPMIVARWPNDGFTRTGEVLDPGSRPRRGEKPDRGARFRFTGDRPARWTEAADLRLVGYWQHDWADDSIAVSHIDAEKREIALAAPHQYGVASGKPYYAENLLEEIDAPGEYYIDRTAGILYFYPPKPLEGVSLALSRMHEPLVSLRDTSDIVIRDLIFQCARGDGAEIGGGVRVRFLGCTFRTLGNRAVVINGGSEHNIVSCDIYQTGEGGVVLAGGDRATLTPARHAAVNCHIHRYSRLGRTYRPAIRIRGVGQRAAHNKIHDAPHAAILFSGNDHLIEYNEIHDVLRLTGDGGAVYTGRDWSMRGTIIRYNHFHDLRGIGRWENAVYIDDMSGGVTILGNVFRDCHWGMLLGGGRDMVVANNVFVDCGLAVHLDARGLGWASGSFDLMKERLEAMPYRQEPWASRYPPLLDLLDDEPMTPKDNHLRCNVLVRSGAIDADIAGAARRHAVIEQNLRMDDDPGFVDFAGGDLRLRADSAVFTRLPDFTAIPFEEIGLRADEHRPSAPARETRGGQD
ncbi:MAG: right-handed parallel beta-helix repeat-containing protein [Planctomycetota bacterium]|nr:right-handed parallel beta-helix repeat-containing protein [Planctomycetota bacterium]